MDVSSLEAGTWDGGGCGTVEGAKQYKWPRAACARGGLHASLMAQGHQATDTAAFRQRRESTQEALRGAVENAQGLHARTLGRLESAVIDGARQAMQWSDRIAHSTKATLHRSRPKKILVANLDLQDTTYSWMVQQKRVSARLAAGTYRRCHRSSLTKAGTDRTGEMGLHQGFIAPNIRHEYALSSKDQQNAHRMLKEVLANETYDAVIANVWSPGLYVLLEHEGQDLTQIPIVLYDRHMHHALAENGLQGERVALLKSHDLYLNCMLEADPRSQNMQDRFDVGFPKSRIHCWPWSVAAGFFLNEPSKRKGRCPYPPSTKTCFKLFSGGDSKRDYASLFKAVEGMDVELRIASGRTFEQLPENVSALGRIFLHEFRDEVRNCDAVVIPLGAAEGMDTGAAGITVFALAFALGKPVICTDHGFTRRYIVHGENGLLVEQSDWKGLREAILRLDAVTRGMRSVSGKGTRDLLLQHGSSRCLSRAGGHTNGGSH